MRFVPWILGPAVLALAVGAGLSKAQADGGASSAAASSSSSGGATLSVAGQRREPVREFFSARSQNRALNAAQRAARFSSGSCSGSKARVSRRGGDVAVAISTGQPTARVNYVAAPVAAAAPVMTYQYQAAPVYYAAVPYYAAAPAASSGGAAASASAGGGAATGAPTMQVAPFQSNAPDIPIPQQPDATPSPGVVPAPAVVPVPAPSVPRSGAAASASAAS